MGVGVQGRGRRLLAAADNARDAGAPRAPLEGSAGARGLPLCSSQPRVPWLLTLSNQSDWLWETGHFRSCLALEVPHDYAEAAARYRAIPKDALRSHGAGVRPEQQKIP